MSVYGLGQEQSQYKMRQEGLGAQAPGRQLGAKEATGG